jgi:hypothetical protein
MAEFTAVPEGVLLVRKLDGMHPGIACLDGEILPLPHHRFSFDRDAVKKVDGMDDAGTLGDLPIYAIPAFRKLRGEFLVFVLPDTGLAERMAAGALLAIHVIGAGGEDRLAVDDPLAVMAGAAMEALAVGSGADSRGLGLHGKSDIDMAEATGEPGAMQPVIEDDSPRAGWSRRVGIENHLAVIGGLRRGRFRQVDLRQRSADQEHNCADGHEQKCAFTASRSFRFVSNRSFSNRSFSNQARKHKRLGTFEVVPCRPFSAYRRALRGAAAKRRTS